MNIPSQEEIQMFLELASFMPPREDHQTCLIIGTDRAAELIYSWLSGTLIITEDLIESTRKYREECFSEESRERFIDSLNRVHQHLTEVQHIGQ